MSGVRARWSVRAVWVWWVSGWRVTDICFQTSVKEATPKYVGGGHDQRVRFSQEPPHVGNSIQYSTAPHPLHLIHLEHVTMGGKLPHVW